jgi:hypothetical protein
MLTYNASGHDKGLVLLLGLGVRQRCTCLSLTISQASCKPCLPVTAFAQERVPAQRYRSGPAEKREQVRL